MRSTPVADPLRDDPERALTKELEILHSIAVTALRDHRVTVRRDDSAPTSFSLPDKQQIVVTIQNVPERLRAYPLAVSRMFDALTLHEAGHCLKTAPLLPSLAPWVERNDPIGKTIQNIGEDVRVDAATLSRWRFDDYGKRYAYHMKVIGEAYHAEVLRQVRSGKVTGGEAFLGALSVQGVYGVDSADILREASPYGTNAGRGGRSVAEFQIAAPVELRNALEVLRRYKTTLVGFNAVNLLEELLVIVRKFLPPDSKDENGTTINGGPGSGFGAAVLLPHFGGKLTLTGAVKAEAEAKAEQQAKDEAEAKKNGETKQKPTTGISLNNGGGKGYGRGDGSLIPTPEPNPSIYRRVENSVRPQVRRLLDLLKRTSRPLLVTTRYQRSGRIMSQIVSRAVAQSYATPVEHIHARPTFQVERAKTAIALIVDLSGSMDQLTAQKVLTVIAEVCGQWLRDEQFAIVTFGSGYQRVKGFVEAYNNTKARIGGLENMGGTELLAPLEEVHKMLRSVSTLDGTKRVLVIVSDFSIPEETECRAVVNLMRAEGIGVVGIVLGGSMVEAVSVVGQRATEIRSVEELPEAFFEVYKQEAL